MSCDRHSRSDSRGFSEPRAWCSLQKAEVWVPRIWKGLLLVSPPKAPQTDPPLSHPSVPPSCCPQGVSGPVSAPGEGITGNRGCGQHGFVNSAPLWMGVRGQPVLGDCPHRLLPCRALWTHGFHGDSCSSMDAHLRPVPRLHRQRP